MLLRSSLTVLMLGLMITLTSVSQSLAFSHQKDVLAYHTQTSPYRVVYPTQQQVVQQTPTAILQQIKARNGLNRIAINRVQIVRSNQLNAATDGTSIYMTDKLWNTLGTNDRRAFVISHELAHITANHIPQTQLRRTGLSLFNRYVLGQVFPESRWWDVASQLSMGLVDRKFSRGMEYEADDLGLRMMTNAGYDPQAAIETLYVLEKASPGYIPEFLSDHPLDRQRVARLAQKYDLAAR